MTRPATARLTKDIEEVNRMVSADRNNLESRPPAGQKELSL